MNKEHKDYYLYLEELRQSGVTNMYGATPYLMSAFDLDHEEASKILIEWMQNYNEISKEFY